MPLNEQSVARDLVHERQIICRGYARRDGLWDIEATLQDTKSQSIFLTERGEIKPHEPIHEMLVCVTIDPELLIHDVRVEMFNSPHSVCPAITEAYKDLVGLNIGSGFIRDVKRRFGGLNGCTHINEMFAPLATTAYQTLWDKLDSPKKSKRGDGWQVNGCHALREDGEVTRREFPELYRPKK